jgi:glutathione S-transferase
MLTLYYAPGACSMAPHIVLEEGGEKYEARRVDFSKAEQRTEAYMKTVHPLGRVPALGGIDAGAPLTENTAILPYLGKRYKLWPTDPVAEARALSLIGFFAATVHPAHAHISRPERYATDKAHFPDIQEQGRKSFQTYLQQIDGMLAGRQWLSDSYSVLDPYAFTFYVWGVRREVPMAGMKNYTAHKDRMLARPAVQRVVEDEKLKV